MQTNALVDEIKNAHSSRIFALCRSRDGTFLASASANATVNIWRHSHSHNHNHSLDQPRTPLPAAVATSDDNASSSVTNGTGDTEGVESAEAVGSTESADCAHSTDAREDAGNRDDTGESATGGALATTGKADGKVDGNTDGKTDSNSDSKVDSPVDSPVLANGTTGNPGKQSSPGGAGSAGGHAESMITRVRSLVGHAGAVRAIVFTGRDSFATAGVGGQIRSEAISVLCARLLPSPLFLLSWPVSLLLVCILYLSLRLFRLWSFPSL